MVHDAGPRERRPARLVAAFPGCAAVVYGHTHLPEISQHDGVWILNPGSPTERRRAPDRSLLTLELDGEQLRPQLVLLP
jgi:predicted phosphodiesterase